jgi:hypothetical protein
MRKAWVKKSTRRLNKRTLLKRTAVNVGIRALFSVLRACYVVPTKGIQLPCQHGQAAFQHVASCGMLGRAWFGCELSISE